VCDLDVMVVPSKLSVIRKAASLARAKANPAFELCRESRAAEVREVELPTVCLRKLAKLLTFFSFFGTLLKESCQSPFSSFSSLKQGGLLKS
jgi:hypothetical protein